MVEAATGRPSRLETWWAAPIWVHVAALTIVLLGAVALIGADGMFSSDEAAPMLQAQLLHEGRGWVVANPLPQLDPTGTQFFLAHSDGGPLQFAPYGKHPLYPLVLVPITSIAGTTGATALSVLGTVLAAGAAAALAGLIARSQARAAFWVTGLLSPLFFDGALVMAHSLGAACCGWLTWLALTATDAPAVRRVVRWIAMGLLMGTAVLIRTEALLFAAAIGLVLVVVAIRHRRIVPALTATLLVGCAGAALVFERMWYSRTFAMTAAVPSPAATSDLGSVVVGRLQALGWTFFAPTGRGAGPVVVVALVVTFLMVLAAVRLRRSPPAWTEAAGLLVAAAAVAMLGVVVSPDAISGLLVAFPLLTFGLVSMRRADLDRWPVATLAGICVTFSVLVVATTYTFGGAAEWGGRFLALALPLAVPVVLQPVVRLWSSKRPERIARRALVGLVVASIGMTLIGVHALVASHDRTAEIAEAFGALVTSDGVVGSGPDTGDGDRRPIVLSADVDLGRFAWSFHDAARGISVPAEDMAEVLGRMDAAPGATVVLYGELSDEDRARLSAAGWSVERTVRLSTGAELLVVRHEP